MSQKQLTTSDVVPVVIGSSYNAYGVIRSFAEEGIRSILITGRNKCFVQYSKYLEKHIVMTDVNQDELKFIEELIEFGKKLSPRRGMFFPTHDEQLSAIARHKNELAPYYEFPFSDWEICVQIMDKAKFRSRCESLGIPTIKERLVSSVPEAVQCLETLRLPLIVKANSTNPRMIKKVGSKNALFRDAKAYEVYVRHYFDVLPGENLLVQEYIEDSDVLMPNVNCFTDSTGVMKCVFVSEKVRQYPPNTGTSTTTNAVSPENPMYSDIIEYTRKMLKSFQFYGLSGTEFKYDPKEKNYKIIETNPRSEFPNYLQTFVGQNMAYQLYLYHLGKPTTIPYYPVLKRAQCVVPFNDYFYAVHLNKLNYPDSVLTKAEWKASLVNPSIRHGLTSKDIKPFVYAYLNSAWQGLNSYIRIKNKIPATTRTMDYFLKRKRK